MNRIIFDKLDEMPPEELYQFFEDTLLSKHPEALHDSSLGPIEALCKIQQQISITHNDNGIQVTAPVLLALDNMLTLIKQGDLQLNGKLIQLLLEILGYMRMLQQKGASSQQQVVSILDNYHAILSARQIDAGTVA